MFQTPAQGQYPHARGPEGKTKVNPALLHARLTSSLWKAGM